MVTSSQWSQRVDPIAEDEGLFQTEIVQIDVLLTPLTMQTNRGDFLLSGRMPDSREFEVAICGRRTAAAAGLLAELAYRWGRAMRVAAKRGSGQPDPFTVRLPVTMEGAWRTQMRRDDSGWETKHYRIIAARWTFIRVTGDIDVAGEMPHVTKDAVRHAVHERCREYLMPEGLALTG